MDTNPSSFEESFKGLLIELIAAINSEINAHERMVTTSVMLQENANTQIV